MSDLAIRNLFIIPTVLFLIIFNIFPLLYSLGFSFTDFAANQSRAWSFVGLANYRDLLSDPRIWSNFVITAKYVIVSVSGQMLVGFGLALLLNRSFPAERPCHHASAFADDDVAGGRRAVLEAASTTPRGDRSTTLSVLAISPGSPIRAWRSTPWRSPISGCGRLS